MSNARKVRGIAENNIHPRAVFRQMIKGSDLASFRHFVEGFDRQAELYENSQVLSRRDRRRIRALLARIGVILLKAHCRIFAAAHHVPRSSVRVGDPPPSDGGAVGLTRPVAPPDARPAYLRPPAP